MRKEMVVQLAGGLEARPIAVLVQVASQFESSIYLEADEKRVNAKSIMEKRCIMLEVLFKDIKTLSELKAFLGRFYGVYLDYVTALYWQWFEKNA